MKSPMADQPSPAQPEEAVLGSISSSADVPLTPSQRTAAGKRARSTRPRSAVGSWEPSDDRPDPVDQLEAQARTRVHELVPIRYGRMAASAFAFYRGAAAVMAYDLGSHASTGLGVQLCGDAHLVNFGGFATPDRRMVFDLNDFDETHPGPFEWDVQRLAASFEIAGRDRGFDVPTRTEAVLRTAAAYRSAMLNFATMTDLDVWYLRLGFEEFPKLLGEQHSKKMMARLQKAVIKAQHKDRYRALAKLTTRVDGELAFISDPPLIVPARELFSEIGTAQFTTTFRGVLDSYRGTLAPSNRHLLEGYRYLDMARKVVGVGSVGTRTGVALLIGRDEDDPLILQIKEAEASVLEPYTGPSTFHNHGQRVVVGQSLTQAASDPFLGWDRVEGFDGVPRDYYVRQLWDWKASADLATMPSDVLSDYGQACGWTLARAHARTGDRIAIAGYLGSSDVFERSIAAFASSYADQNELDHAALVKAIASGRVQALSGV